MDRLQRFLTALFLLFTCQYLQCQNILVNGTVTNELGQPLYEANVIVSGTNRGTTTNPSGYFAIEADSTEQLEISYIGYAKTLIRIGDQTSFEVQMRIANALDEVVVIGYGETTLVKLTDNIAKVDSEQIKEIPIAAVQGTLVGKTAGVQITQTSGRVDSDFKIRVRGVSTITGNQEPLYVVDGIPIIKGDASFNGSPTNSLVNLNPDDIASIEVLKDASAAAIYGSRGTNGVVIITTKSGQEGKTKVSFRSSFGFSEPTKRRDFLNTNEYVNFYTEAALNSGFTEDDAAFFFNLFAVEESDWSEGNINTDWQDLLFRNGSIQDIGFNVSGGNDKTKFFISTGYNRTNGILRGNTLERYSLRVNLDHSVNRWLNLGTNTTLSKTQISRLPQDGNFANPIQAIAQVPFSRPYEEDGVTPNPQTLYYNFLYQDTNADYDNNTWRGLLKLFAEIDFNRDLSFRSEFGYDYYNQNEEQFSGSLTEAGFSTNGLGSAGSAINEKYVLNNYFTYNLDKENWDLNMVLGMSYEEDILKVQEVDGQDFPSDQLRTLESAGEISGGFSFETAFSFVSYFTRASLSLKDKFLFKASVRVDGSSRFGSNNRYGTFPAFSAGWIISEEPFIKDRSAISNLKLRANWGITGNADIGNFVSRTNFSPIRYNLNPGLWISTLGDPEISWEDTEQYNIGLDLGFFKNRIFGSIDYYNKDTDGILFREIIPSTNGIRFVFRNAGRIVNEGVEFTLETKNIISENFRWSTSFNIAYNKNEVVSLPDSSDFFRDPNIFREGEAASSFFLVEYAGVDPENGDALFYRNTELPDGTLDRSTTNNYGETSRIIAGNPFPDIIAGLTNTLLWKGFDMSFVFQGQWGASIYNGAGIFQSANGDIFDNQSRDQLKRWQQAGDVTDVPQARLFGANGNQESTRYLEDADFIRLRDLTLGYTLPAIVTDPLGISRIRLYFSGLNLLTFAKYSGYDPESTWDIDSRSGAFNGIDFFSPPPARTFTLGINVDF